MSGKKKILILICGTLAGAVNGAIAGFIFGYILAWAYGWNPYFASLKGALSCSVVGTPTGFFGSSGLFFLRKARARLTFFIACGAAMAVLLFLAYAENTSEVKSGVLYGLIMGAAIGAMIGGCVLALVRAMKKGEPR
jgi:hypothetical protein